MPEENKKTVIIEMPYDRFHCIKKTIEGLQDTIHKLGIHEGFKQSMVNDLKSVSAMLTTQKKGG